MNKNATFTYIIDSIDMWHARLGHVNVDSIRSMKNLNLIPNLTNLKFTKCKICVETKHHKKPFKSIEKTSSLSELNLGDFKNNMSRGGKKYYITFIDDYSRYTKLYLLSQKDEVEKMFITFKNEVENQLEKKN
ncbi:hypothetical protein ACH5RR_028561 [Cinchona calisaya]|uniref:GAG-pre-integrase domain-containing protein n=1 Tax=Cinchona calisaya TaxID=153742 RepID=A0ABD2YSS0_9GENT